MGETQIHKVIMEGRSRLDIQGVEQIDSFDAKEIILSTNMGDMKIGGEGLHISRLELNDRQLSITGEISCVLYIEGGGNKKEKGRKLLSRLVR